MRYLKQFLIIVVLLSIGIVNYSSAEQRERPIVRLIYFLPKDREPQPDINEKLGTMIKDTQTLFANQMEAHGFDRKTFLYETEENGKAVVHKVIGKFTDEYYNNLEYTWDMWTEIEELRDRFDLSKDIYITVIDISGEILDSGVACGRGGGWNDTGRVLMPASGSCFTVSLLAHELGHAFGLNHGFYGRDIENKQIWTYFDDQMLNTFWSADWFDVHTAFNTKRDTDLNTEPLLSVRMLPPSLATPPNEIRLRFEITGSNANLHQAQLLKPPARNDLYPLFLAGKRLSTTPDSNVEFVTTALTPNDRHVYIQMIDKNGNMTQTQDFPINITPLLPPESESFPPTNIRGSGSAIDITYSPDGQYFAVAGGIGISLYDADTNVPLNLLSHTATHKSIDFSPDGQFLVTGDHHDTVYLWDIGTGEILDTMSGNTLVLDVAFSHDGKLVAIAGSDGSIRLWDVHNDIIHSTLQDRVFNIRSVAFSSDGKTLASGGLDNIVRLWDINTSKILHTLNEHQDWIESVAFSPDGKTLASAALENNIYLWDVDTGKIQDTFRSNNAWTFSIAFSPDGNMLASGGIDSIELWDVSTGKIRDTYKGHLYSVNSVAFSIDGSILASVSGEDSRICLWDVNTGKSEHTYPEHSAGISRVLYSFDGQTLVTQEPNTIRLWDVGTGRVRHTFTGISRSPFTFSLDSQFLASKVWRENRIYIWDVNTGEIQNTLPIEEDDSVKGITFSSNGQTLISAIWSSHSQEGSIRLWDVNTGEILQTLPISLQGYLNDVVFSPDRQTFAATIGGGTIQLWDVNTGKIHHTLIGHNDSIKNIIYSSDGNTLVSASSDASVRFWDVLTGKNSQNPIRHRSSVNSLALSPNGNTIATASLDTIQLWDVKTGKHNKTLKAEGIIRSMAFSPDGQTLSAGGFQGTVQFWEASSDLPLPVSLSLFTAKQTRDGVVLNWTTESEVDNAGFNILRSKTKAGAFKQINTRLIAGAGTTGEQHTYNWTDSTAKPNTVYFYRIEDVSHTGEREKLATVRLKGLISATGKLITQWSELKHNLKF